MSTDASASEEALRDRIRKGGFAVALSGGGHRATLATLGALMAIVDRGLGPKVIQVASVSGGSITNAFVAQRRRLEKLLGPGELDDIAAELASTIIRKGVLTRGWITLLFLTAISLGVIAGIFLRVLVVPWTWLAVSFGIVVSLTVLILTGLVVEWLLDRRYFGQGISAEGHRPWDRARFASLSGGTVDHVFCMTDLVLGLPVYASSQHGGMMWRRLQPERRSYRPMEFQTFEAGQMSIAEVVRASAAFPGIPPRRLKIPPDPRIKLVAELPQLAFLADGGLWNNLGSQVLREDRFIGSHAAWEDGVLRPYGPAPEDTPLLCVNGSAPLRPTHPWVFKCPGLALIKSLLQTTQILNANTVLPRVDAMRRRQNRRFYTNRRPDHFDPADLLVNLSPAEDIRDYYQGGIWNEELIRKSDASVTEWEKSALIRVRLAREHAPKSPGETDWLGYVLGTQPEPQGSYPVCGLANLDSWDALWDSPTWKQLIEKEGTGRVDAPTTLGRIESCLARRLIARGYLNTYLVSLYLAPLANGELDRLAKLPDRLDKIAGS